ncbi:MAG: glycine/betaine ABC transporter permease [Candidatus Cloacimonadota bacterium]|nr:MAG: glycine/betaine ABC transporter permease [Candidatus Cloacimonadota bacterium]
MNKSIIVPSPKPKSLTFTLSLIIMILFVGGAFFAGDKIELIAKQISSFFNTYFSWFYILTTSGILLYLIYLSFSRFANIVLGDPDSKPEFSNLSWISMLFSAGMGVGLLFWGVAEPIIHFTKPPLADPNTIVAARQALMHTAFHWGLHGWGVYTACAVCIAYFSFRKGKKYLISSCVIDLFENKSIRYFVKTFVDLTSVLAVIMGMSASLGMGLKQMGTGLNLLTGLNTNSFEGYLVILIIVTICFLLSAGTGLEKGIKYLSNANMLVAAGLLLFVFCVGPKLYMINTFVDSTGVYLSNLINLSFRMIPMDKDYNTWFENWTILYFTWWIAWTPFVGVFIARISKGRTIQQVILGSLFIPTIFTLIWFAVFGGSAIYLEMNKILDLGEIVSKDTVAATFSFLKFYPYYTLTASVTIVLIFTFLVTSADSATFVISMMTSEGDLNPTLKIKLVWGITMSLVTIILLKGGGLPAIQAVALMAAFPFSFILIMMLISLYKELNKEVQQDRL